MILQKLTYPDGAEFNENMYVRCNHAHVALIGEEHQIVSSNYRGQIGFDTYFNSLSYQKWKKYTRLSRVKLSLEIKGKCRLVLIGLELHGDEINRTILGSIIVDFPERETVVVDYPEKLDSDTLCFSIFPLSDTLEIFDGAYISDAQEETLPEITLALAICTYSREDYIARNMQMLKKCVFDEPDALLHGHVRVLIADNGNTLDAAAFDSRYVRLVPNKNSGKSFHASHIILMDDDIEFHVDALERTYTFLRMLKPEYAISMIGGAMFRTDYRYIQHAAGETQTVDGIIFNKVGYNMNKLLYVMRNEIEEPFNYLGWWLCCIPVQLFERAHFSLPLFVQFDDIEFSLRNRDVPKITLNGICCWHIPFDKKRSGVKNYYTIRNRTIVNALCFDNYTKGRFIRDFGRTSIRCMFQYGYNEANLILLGAEDYLKGLSWLIEQDPVSLNTKVISLSDKLVDTDKLPIPFDIRTLQRNKDFGSVKRHVVRRFITVNGWLLPANRTVTVEVDNPPIRYLYRAGTVLKYDVNSGKALVVERDYHQAFHILGRLMKLVLNTLKSFDRVRDENKKLYETVITKEFWKHFLNF